MRVSFIGEITTIRKLREDLTEQALISDVTEAVGTPAEVERLGFDLNDILTIVGAITAAIDVFNLAKLLLKAASGAKNKKIEVIGPTGRVLIDLADKTDEEVAQAVKQALPFLG
ncbi:hypothetical protein IFT84_11345 [Rhizobium sp. CFBP 8762]|uniref:hypothetical protein n=1 Tax=Rhizobium sp. CFBP 8762 TaxID=2775279 RepID=UPI00178504DF|nr:hypothetical protein [Rhizobium sp. CFBP 8762]MBD8555118.1 hypothetical protein [Rhizobium sp. CFBP 8762]